MALPNAIDQMKEAQAKRGPRDLPNRYALRQCEPLPDFAAGLVKKILPVYESSVRYRDALAALDDANADAEIAEEQFKTAKPTKRAAAEEKAIHTAQGAKGAERDARFALREYLNALVEHREEIVEQIEQRLPTLEVQITDLTTELEQVLIQRRMLEGFREEVELPIGGREAKFQVGTGALAREDAEALASVRQSPERDGPVDPLLMRLR